MRKVVRALKAEACGNVRLHLGDARRVIDWLPDAALDRVDVLYPDPWPKPRHWKRRFISTAGHDADRVDRLPQPLGACRRRW